MILPIGVGGYRASTYSKKLVMKVLDSGRLSYGPFTKRFEDEFSRLHDVRFACFMNSGTDALRISLNTLKLIHRWRDWDEVIVPSVTFVATANIVYQNMLTPVFCDVDEKTYNINPHKIKDRITDRTRAIIPVHLMGLPCDMTSISDIALRNGLKIIEDSCETMFGECDGRKVGSIGNLGCFSTYVAHFIVTGVGGIVTTNNPDYATKVRSLMNHGRNPSYITIDDDDDRRSDKFLEIVRSRFDFVDVGYSSRCTEMEAALGCAQLSEYRNIIKSRKSVADFYTKSLSRFKNKLQLPCDTEYSKHMYMLYPIVVLHERNDGIVSFLEKNGIETRPLMPILFSSVYRRLDPWWNSNIDSFPVAKWLNEHGFYIGCHQYITKSQAEYVVRKIKEYLK